LSADTIARLKSVDTRRQFTAASAFRKQEYSLPRDNRGIVNTRLLRQLSGSNPLRREIDLVFPIEAQ
jgi:hypothetical protein